MPVSALFMLPLIFIFSGRAIHTNWGESVSQSAFWKLKELKFQRESFSFIEIFSVYGSCEHGNKGEILIFKAQTQHSHDQI